MHMWIGNMYNPVQHCLQGEGEPSIQQYGIVEEILWHGLE